MATPDRITKYCGVVTFVLGAVWVLLSGLLILALGLADGCQDGSLKYFGCTWRGVDISLEVTLLGWYAYWFFFLFLTAGLTWLSFKAVFGWRDPEYAFLRWWLLLIAGILLFATFAGQILSLFVA